MAIKRATTTEDLTKVDAAPGAERAPETQPEPSQVELPEGDGPVRVQGGVTGHISTVPREILPALLDSGYKIVK